MDPETRDPELRTQEETVRQGPGDTRHVGEETDDHGDGGLETKRVVHKGRRPIDPIITLEERV